MSIVGGGGWRVLVWSDFRMNLQNSLLSHFSVTIFGSHLGTLALKTRDFSKKKSVVLVKRKNGFTKTLFSLFFQGFLSRGWF